MRLSDSISTISGVGIVQANRLAKLNIYTVEDLLLHVPFRYDDFREIHKIASFPINEIGTLMGEILEFKNQYTKQGKQMQTAKIYDGTGHTYAIWFNQPFLARTFEKNQQAYFSGKMGFWNKNKAIYNPDFELIADGKEAIHTARLVPVYHETYGISSKWLRVKIFSLLQNLNQLDIEEFLPQDIIDQYNLENLTTSLMRVHFSDNLEDANKARKRLAFNELLHVQIDASYRRIAWQKNELAKKLSIDVKTKTEFLSLLPFQLTSSQTRSINEIFTDLVKQHPMNRLLEGDVGSGKTVVAGGAAFAAFKSGYKTILMAPTQILANQHFNTLTKLFSTTKVKIGIITSQTKNVGKETDIIIGTHALLHSKEKLQDVGLIIIDEQHRFGVRQRAHLIKKTKKGSISPHVLTMTATPIPRTVALTLYGDLDLSTIDELPKGRTPTTTWVVPPHKRQGAYKWIDEQLQNGGQVFIVCPLVEESESESLKSVKSAKSEFETLKKIFPKRRLGLMHGKLKNNEKDNVIADFRANYIDILVTTPVVEVGVDIPNATVMVIEAAERFGLASLHQLRGRVGRGDKQSFCLLFTESKDISVLKRLISLKQKHSGFELAEMDLSIRGPGELTGTAQHGFAGLSIASWSDHELIHISREVAHTSLDNPIKFAKLLKAHKGRSIIEN